MASILVVEDDPDVRLLLEQVLGLSGHEVAAVPGGREALAWLGGRRSDIVVLDVQMPDFDGWSTLEAIRRAPATAELPVILCTVRSGCADAAHGWELGCDGWVEKPFNPSRLVAEVQRILGLDPCQRAASRARGFDDAHAGLRVTRDRAGDRGA